MTLNLVNDMSGTTTEGDTIDGHIDASMNGSKLDCSFNGGDIDSVRRRRPPLAALEDLSGTAVRSGDTLSVHLQGSYTSTLPDQGSFELNYSGAFQEGLALTDENPY